jgi:hypothetical protein
MRQRSILLLCMLVLLGVFGWYYFHAANVVQVQAIPCADITKGCGNQQLQIHFDRTPQVMKPFNLSVKAASASEVHASFAMQSMEMGLNRYRLLQKPDGLWQAEVTLPVCIQGRSDWLVELEVKTPQGMQRYQLPFSSQ